MYILADIGGTKTRIARSDDLESFAEPLVFDTPQTYEEGVELLVKHANALSGSKSIHAIMMGLPGVLSRDKRTLFDAAHHLAHWNHRNIAGRIETTLGTRVFLENDTALVGLGESHFGAGKDVALMAYITVSTGVNGVRIVDGMIDRAMLGFEIGDQFMTLDNPPKMLEDLVSGSYISKKYGKHPRELGNDSPVWDELAHMLALGLHNTIVHWSPEVIVLGGSMFNDIGISVGRVEEHLWPLLMRFPERPRLVHSSLASVGGLWGGLARLKQLTVQPNSS